MANATKNAGTVVRSISTLTFLSRVQWIGCNAAIMEFTSSVNLHRTV